MIVYAFPEFMRFLLSLRYRGRLLQVSPCTGVYPPENLRFDIVMIFFFYSFIFNNYFVSLSSHGDYS